MIVVAWVRRHWKGIIAAVLVIIVIVGVADWFWGILVGYVNPKDAGDRNDVFQTFALIVAGAVGVIGAIVGIANLSISLRNLKQQWQLEAHRREAREREAEEARERELKGLTLLLFTEIGHNDALIRTFQKFPDVMGVHSFTSLQTDIWINTRVRLAQLVTNEHTSTLVTYYGKIQDILKTVNDDTMPDEIKAEFVTKDAEKALTYGKAAMIHGGKYMFVDYPEFTDDKHARFVEEARRLMGKRSDPGDAPD